MKLFVMTLSLFASSLAFAATTKTKVAVNNTTSTSVAPAASTSSASIPPIFVAPATERKLFFDVNIADLSRGAGNVAFDFFGNDKVSFNVRYKAASEREDVKRRGVTTKMTVDRTMYGVGGTFWVRGSNAPQNILITPYIAFGSRRDQEQVDNLNGIGMKLTGLVHAGKDLTIEAGLNGDNLEDGDFRGNPFLGLGYLF